MLKLTIQTVAALRIGPALPTCVPSRSVAHVHAHARAAAAGLVATATLHPLPAVAAIPGTATLLADELFLRDPVDLYYGAILAVSLVLWAKQSFQNTIKEAKDYDRRGKLANDLAREARKRNVAARRQEMLDEDPATARLVAERRQRERKQGGWKVFPGFKSVPPPRS